MEKLMIAGRPPAKGTVGISGAKNSAVALIPAAILAESDSEAGQPASSQRCGGLCGILRGAWGQRYLGRMTRCY